MNNFIVNSLFYSMSIAPKIRTFIPRNKILFLIVVFVAVLLLPYFIIFSTAWGKVFFSVLDIEDNSYRVGIVLGAAVWGNGPSPAFADRLMGAMELYNAGKIKKILISGDNSSHDYNEPQNGKNFLIKNNIPASDIVLDYAGFRTYDTCVRAKKVFGLNKAIVITQEFHLYRSVFLCQNAGIKTVGFSARSKKYVSQYSNFFREALAHQKAFYEVYLFPHDPKFLGEKEAI